MADHHAALVTYHDIPVQDPVPCGHTDSDTRDGKREATLAYVGTFLEERAAGGKLRDVCWGTQRHAHVSVGGVVVDRVCACGIHGVVTAEREAGA
jgi:hypothetical protein